MTTIDRTPADSDSRNAAHTTRSGHPLPAAHEPAATGAANRSALRRRLKPVLAVAVGAGLACGGPALTAHAADGAPAQPSDQHASQQAAGHATGQVPESQQAAAAAEHTFSSPVPAGTGAPTSGFLERENHAGTDFAVAVGTPITSVSEGTVLRTATSGEDGALKHHTGKGVVIDHGEINGDHMYSYYGHLDEVQVEEGDTVEAGTQIGESGNTGNSTGPHLHLGVFMNAEDPNGAIWNADSGVGFIDPVAWLDRKDVDAGQDAPVEP